MKNRSAIGSVLLISLLLLVSIGCTSGPAGIDGQQDSMDSSQTVDSYQSAERVAERVVAAAEDAGDGNVARVSDDYVRITIDARQFEYSPSSVSVSYGDNVMLTVTSIDVGHGFALPDFGINKRIPAEESVTFTFIADKRGEFEFFNSVYSGKDWKNMRGTFTVR
ncbi:MAG: cupredoxin domain-containing protein [Candidatus Woesearchaeota archaeon]